MTYRHIDTDGNNRRAFRVTHNVRYIILDDYNIERRRNRTGKRIHHRRKLKKFRRDLI